MSIKILAYSFLALVRSDLFPFCFFLYRGLILYCRIHSFHSLRVRIGCGLLFLSVFHLLRVRIGWVSVFVLKSVHLFVIFKTFDSLCFLFHLASAFSTVYSWSISYATIILTYFLL